MKLYRQEIKWNSDKRKYELSSIQELTVQSYGWRKKVTKYSSPGYYYKTKLGFFNEKSLDKSSVTMWYALSLNKENIKNLINEILNKRIEEINQDIQREKDYIKNYEELIAD